MGGDISRSVRTAVTCAIVCAISVGVLLAVGSKKHRMFAVLLWALRVHSISAAARLVPRACSFYHGPTHDDNLCEPDRNILECKLVSGAFGLGGLVCNP